MYEWQKLGRVLDPSQITDIEWMKDFAQAPSTLVMPDRVRVFFACRPDPDSTGQFVSYIAYADFDRKNLLRRLDISRERPLQLGDLGTFDEFGTNPASVIRNGDEVWVYYAGWSRCETVPFNAAIGVAVSRDDGRTFARVGKGPVLSYSPDEPFVIGSPRIRKFGDTFYLWYVAGRRWIRGQGRPEPVYKIRLATSKNGLEFKKHGQDLIVSKLDDDECQASPDVFFRDGKYHMYFSFRHALGFKHEGRGYRIGYASSADLLTWQREDSIAAIATSRQGWDSESVSYPHVFELDGNWYMYYQGNHVGKTGFGLARMVGTP